MCTLVCVHHTHTHKITYTHTSSLSHSLTQGSRLCSRLGIVSLFKHVLRGGGAEGRVGGVAADSRLVGKSDSCGPRRPARPPAARRTAQPGQAGIRAAHCRRTGAAASPGTAPHPSGHPIPILWRGHLQGPPPIPTLTNPRPGGVRMHAPFRRVWICSSRKGGPASQDPACPANLNGAGRGGRRSLT